MIRLTIEMLCTVAFTLLVFGVLCHTSGDPVSSAWKALIAAILLVGLMVAMRLDSRPNEAKPIRFAPGDTSDRV